MKQISLIAILCLGLAACSSDGISFLDEAKALGAENTKVVKQWEKGRDMVEDGEALVRKGKSKVKKGRALIDDGQDEQEKGQRMIQQGERMRFQAEDDFRLVKNSTPSSQILQQNSTIPYYPE